MEEFLSHFRFFNDSNPKIFNAMVYQIRYLTKLSDKVQVFLCQRCSKSRLDVKVDWRKSSTVPLCNCTQLHHMW